MRFADVDPAKRRRAAKSPVKCDGVLQGLCGGVFCFLLIREISCSPSQPKVRRSAEQQGLAVRPVLSRRLAGPTRHGAAASRHGAVLSPRGHPSLVRLLFMQPPLRLPLPRESPVVPLTMPNRIARSITHVYASCVMRSSAHPLMRWRHSGVGGWRGLSGQKIAWALIWFVEASRLHGGKRLRPTAHGARPPLASPPCNPSGPRHFG